jgi:hypothetical protein
MMTFAITLRLGERLPTGALPRGIFAGAAWGLMVGLGLSVLSFLDCGVICLSDVAITTALAVVAGILAIGPLAGFRRAARTPC